jgi:hypothetical protein
MNEWLLWQGYNIGGTYMEIAPYAPQGCDPVRLAVMKVLLGKSTDRSPATLAALVLSLGGASFTAWPDSCKNYRPRIGTDVFVSTEGDIDIKRAPRKGAMGVTLHLEAQIQSHAAAAAEAGMTATSDDALLTEKVAELRRTTIQIETHKTLLMLKRANEAAAEIGMKAAAQAPQQANTMQIYIWNDEDKCEDLFRVRITEIEKYRKRAGILDALAMMIHSEIIPDTLFKTEQQIWEAIAANDPITDVNPTYKARIMVTARMNDERRDMSAKRFSSVIMTETWEALDVLHIRLTLAMTPQEASLCADRVWCNLPAAPAILTPKSTPKRNAEDMVVVPDPEDMEDEEEEVTTLLRTTTDTCADRCRTLRRQAHQEGCWVKGFRHSLVWRDTGSGPGGICWQLGDLTRLDQENCECT